MKKKIITQEIVEKQKKKLFHSIGIGEYSIVLSVLKDKYRETKELEEKIIERYNELINLVI